MQEASTTKKFSLRQILAAFTGLPRVLRLVWDASPPLVTGMACVMLLQGITPLANVIIARLLIDSALQGISHGTIQPLVLPVILQLSEPVLKNISFTLHAGESIALVGQNGAGKTTLVKLLTRLYDPSEGEILIGGHNIKEYDPHELREQIGVIFQDFVRYNMTAGENIGVGRVAELENRVMQEMAAQKSGAEEIIARLDKNYDAMLGHWFEKGADLSGGEWQKIALARAFMRDAPILILDEPTSALDARAEYDIFQRFRNLTDGRSVIFISHRFSTVRLADCIFVIEQGNIIESGSHKELLDLSGKYSELFHLQAEAYQ